MSTTAELRRNYLAGKCRPADVIAAIFAAIQAEELAPVWISLADPDRAIAEAYAALKEDGRGIQRTVYVIGRDGTVRFARRGAPPPDDIVAAVA